MRYGKVALALAVLVTAVACAGKGNGATEDGGLNVELDPNFGSAELESGFTPDPYTVDVQSGGEIDVTALDLGADCAGYATEAPDFRLFLGDSSEMIRIFFVADVSGEDATLIVNEAGSEWVCNDDYGGTDPMIEFEPADEGTYDIWIGSYSAEDIINGTLYITELEYQPSDVE